MPFQQTNQNDTAIEERTLHFILCSTDSALLVSVCSLFLTIPNSIMSLLSSLPSSGLIFITCKHARHPLTSPQSTFAQLFVDIESEMNNWCCHWCLFLFVKWSIFVQYHIYALYGLHFGVLTRRLSKSQKIAEDALVGLKNNCPRSTRIDAVVRHLARGAMFRRTLYAQTVKSSMRLII